MKMQIWKSEKKSRCSKYKLISARLPTFKTTYDRPYLPCRILLLILYGGFRISVLVL